MESSSSEYDEHIEVVLPDDEDRARSKDWLAHVPKFIRKSYEKVRNLDWMCPCVICSNATSRLALVRESPLPTRTVAYVCNDCVHHRRFIRIYRAPRRPRRPAVIVSSSEDTSSDEEEEDQHHKFGAAEESPPVCPTILSMLGVR